MFSRKTIAIDRTSTDLTSCPSNTIHSSLSELMNLKLVINCGVDVGLTDSSVPDGFEIQDFQN